MFEGEQLKSKIYVVCGVSVMKDQNYYPQITALFDNYRDNYSMPKDEFRTMLRYALGWSEEKIERAIQAALDNNVLVDTNLITEEVLTPLFQNGSLKRDSYITSTSLAKIYSSCSCEKYVTPHYQGNHIFAITMTGETLFYLLEQKNDLLFKLYIYFRMNKSYWTDYKKETFNFYIKGKGGAIENLGYSIKSGSTADRIRECLNFLEKSNLIIMGEPISRGRKYGKSLGYWRPLYETRELEKEPVFTNYTLMRIPNFCIDEVTDIVYARMEEKGFPESVPERLMFDII